MFIRELVFSDYEQYINLRKQLGGYEITLNRDEWWGRYNQMVSQGSNIYVGLLEDKMVGTCKLIIETKFSNPVAHIEDVVVDVNFRNLGIGKKIVNYALEKSVLAGCYKCILNCKDELLPFYEKCGMIKEGLLMTKR